MLFASFLAWMRQRGFQWSDDDLTFHDDGHGSRAIIARRALAEAHVLSSMPKESLLTVRNTSISGVLQERGVRQRSVASALSAHKRLRRVTACWRRGRCWARAGSHCREKPGRGVQASARRLLSLTPLTPTISQVGALPGYPAAARAPAVDLVWIRASATSGHRAGGFHLC